MQIDQDNEEHSFKTQLFNNLRNLINVVDQLRDLGVQEYIKLPRIAVLGTQSAGKSSLLENIVGMDFLPRGEGVVTRRPLELRLVHRPEAAKPWAVFENNQNEKFFDFDKVREKIQELTDKIAGTKKGIINNPIVLNVYSSECPDLTIIDLPGITKVALRGSDQGEDIEKVTKEMAKFYCAEERTIILCVIPANQDITTSDGLQMARQLDPEGKRTLGCITKIDIMDRGTDARKMLLGQDVALKLGYVGIKNRSQQDIQVIFLYFNWLGKNSSVKSLVDRRRILRQASCLLKPTLRCPRYKGTHLKTYYSSFLAVGFVKNILKASDHICLKLQKKLMGKLEIVTINWLSQDPHYQEIRKKGCIQFGICLQTTRKILRIKFEGNMTLECILNNLTRRFQEVLKFDYSSLRFIKSNRIIVDLNNSQSKSDYKATSEYSDEQIEKAITLHQGDSIPGFPSFDSFLYLTIPQLEKLKEPALETLNQVFIYMESLSNNILKKVFIRFPQILDEVAEISSRVLQEEKDKARVVVENIIDSELGYIFTNDQEYLTNKASIVIKQEPKGLNEKNENQNPNQSGQQQQNAGQQQPQNQQHKPMDPKKALARELRSRVDSYYKVVLRNLRDSVPKAIGYFLVRASQDQMQYQLYSEILKNQAVMQLLDEPEYIAQERETITQTLKVLRNAQKLLRKDPDLASQQKEESKLQQLKNVATTTAKKIFG